MKSPKIIALIVALVMVGFLGCPKMENKNDDAANMMAKNKAAVMATFDAFNTGKLEGIDSLFAPDYVDHFKDPNIQSTGVQAFKDGVNTYRTAFPDVKITVDYTAAEGDIVFSHWTATGTNTGNLGTMPPTGKSVTVEGYELNKLKDGKISEHWGMYDQMSFMMQLGLMPMPGGESKDTPKSK